MRGPSRQCRSGRAYIERTNALFLFGDKATAAQYKAGLKHALAQGWLEPVHESGTYTRMKQAGADLFA
jgi:hypothetical protein